MELEGLNIGDPMRSDKGYTLIELMVVVVITMIGFMAILMLQAGVIKGNTNTWDVVCATNLAQHVLETIRIEALEWTGKDATQGYDQDKFHYLRSLSSAGIPAPQVSTGWLKAFDLGKNVKFQMVNQAGRDTYYDSGILNEVPDSRNQRFCVQYRLTWIIPDALIRAEVRVLWPKLETAAGNFDACPKGMENQTNMVNQISVATAVMKNASILW